jgi:hypothetical protein
LQAAVPGVINIDAPAAIPKRTDPQSAILDSNQVIAATIASRRSLPGASGCGKSLTCAVSRAARRVNPATPRQLGRGRTG